MKQLLYLLFWGIIFFSCKKPEPALPVPPKEIVLTDTTMVVFSRGFEQILIKKKIIKDTTADGRVRYGEVSNIDTLNIPGYFYENQNMKNLKGIEYFVKLKYMDITGSFLDSVDLSKNTLLEYVACPGLTAAGGGGTYTIKYLNVSNCKKLKFLACYRNLLTSLDVSQNPELTVLYCGENNLKGLDMTHNPNLKMLDVSVNREIKYLNLTAAKGIEELYCKYNALLELDVSMLSELRILDCGNNKYDDKKTFETLDVSKNTKLQTLDISGSRLSKIDLSSNKQLNILVMAVASEIKSIDLSPLKNLTILDAAYSGLEILDPSSNTALTGLEISGTKISNIDLKNNSRLRNFFCRHQGHISSLDLRPCKNLETSSTYHCDNLKTICVNKIPDPADENWLTSEWTKYSLCK